MPLSSPPAPGTLQIAVTAAGKPLDPSLLFASIQVQTGTAGPAAAALVVASTGDAAVPQAADLQPGTPVTLHAGWDGRAAVLFEGIVSSQVLELTETQTQLTIQCHSDPPPVPPTANAPLELAYGAAIRALHITSGTGGVRTGNATFAGTAAAIPGGRLDLTGIGTLFSGEVTLTSVTHQIEGGTWNTTAAFSEAVARPAAFAAVAPTQTTASAPVPTGLGPDQYGNAIVMDASGITLTTKGKFTLKADQDVQLTGQNVTINAQTGAAVKGLATAELSASGQTTVKGAMVMIN